MNGEPFIHQGPREIIRLTLFQDILVGESDAEARRYWESVLSEVEPGDLEEQPASEPSAPPQDTERDACKGFRTPTIEVTV